MKKLLNHLTRHAAACTACLLLYFLAACSHSTPQPPHNEQQGEEPTSVDYSAFGIQKVYTVEWLHELNIAPKGAFQAIRWQLTTPDGVAQESSELPTYQFFARDRGSYKLALSVTEKEHTTELPITIEVIPEKTPYSRYLAHVLTFCPAPGQFVNVLPSSKSASTEEDMRTEAEKSLKQNALISLGAFGGYVIFTFDHPVVNRAGMDFIVFGNAVEIYKKEGANDAEPGCVWVAKDLNKNGKPDQEEWYQLAGSEHHNPKTIHNYSVTYFRPDKEPVTSTDSLQYIRWEDNQGNTGFIPKNKYHAQFYYPTWIKENSYTLSGTRLPDNAINNNGTYLLPNFEYGYVDNYPNSSERARMDIDWAVDNEGNKVSLDRIDFIKVVCGMQQVCGWIGETSTEVMGAADLHIPTK